MLRQAQQSGMACTIGGALPVSAHSGIVSQSLPRELKDFRNHHAGETILVCGCGTSLNDVVAPERFITIGVNDVGRLFQPDYLVVLNPRPQFKADRFRFVEQSQAKVIFTQLDLGIRHPHIVRFRLGRFGGVDFSDPTCLPHTRNSPYVALCLAIHMGAKKIGLIGVDFTHDHFFGATGEHPLNRQFTQIDQEYRRLYEATRRLEIEIVNLSSCSRLTALPKMSPEEFATARRPQKPLKIVSYSTTPVAGVPAILSRCIAARSIHTCRAVWPTNGYGNGVVFDRDVEWQSAHSEAEELVRSADLLIVHNGKVADRHRPLLRNKPVITMAHNYMWNVDASFVQQGWPGVVVGQYQATLPEFKDWSPVPNPIPLWEPAFQPGPKPPQITICYTPSGKHESYPAEHRLYWHSKGYDTTMRVLERLVQRFSIRLEVIRNRQVSHAESLAMKRRAHIVIDECVTGSYHRNSLEGLALGCVVVNGMGRLPRVVDVFAKCAGPDAGLPFVCTGLDYLERTLTTLIEPGTETLAAQGKSNRAWMEQHWDFAQQWHRFWEPVTERSVQRNGRVLSRPGVVIGTRTTEEENMVDQRAQCDIKAGISIVMCHGGQERLPHLGASLANLRQCEGINEIIVVDMGTSPYAEDIARRWADKYIFVHNDGIFERARSLNIGTGLAEFDMVFWLDNDLIVPPDFVSKALAEMRSSHLDYLIPYSRIVYLSALDSKEVIQGVRNPNDCKPTGTYYPLRAVCGGAGIVKKSFVMRYGGLCEDFRGWGGEDDAWWYKSKLFGRAAATQRKDQPLIHLYHSKSGAYGGSDHRDSNPYYSRNIAVLGETRSIGDRATFLKRFPVRTQISCGWSDKQVVFIGSSRGESQHCTTAAIAEAIGNLTGLKASCLALSPDEFRTDRSTEAMPDAAVIFGSSLAASLLAEAANLDLGARAIVIHSGIEEYGARVAEDKRVVQQLRRARTIVCVDPAESAQLKDAGLRLWKANARRFNTAQEAAIDLVQPLSMLLGGPANDTVSWRENPDLQARPEIAAVPPRDANHLPVWMYWEGACPEWIKQCQQTVFRHAPDVRLLSSEEFDTLRDTDRDLDLKRLHVAQRADYVRAFLLARYGGLWIDSDCIVMQSLQPMLDILNEYDFVAHRERTGGFWANDFMGACRGSRIASALYQKIIDRLRSRQPVGWTALGCVSVTETLAAENTSWFEIKSERIQPICWSDSTPFFAVTDAAGHETTLDRRAICYMLSNLTMQKKFHVTDLSEKLLTRGTFFSYLIDESLRQPDAGSNRRIATLSAPERSGLGAPQPTAEIFGRMVSVCSQAGYESLSGPGSSLASTKEIRERLPLLMQDLQVRTVLDAACGDFNWMKKVNLGAVDYVGIDVLPDLIAANRKNYGSPHCSFVDLDLTQQPLPKADMILCRDCLVHFSFADIFRVLRNFKKSQAMYLLATTFPRVSTNEDVPSGKWRPLNFLRPPFSFPEPLRVISEKCTEGSGQYSDKSLALWKLSDIPFDQPWVENVAADKLVLPPGPLARATDTVKISKGMVEVFTRMSKSCSRAGYESRSGPGSSMASTVVLRTELLTIIQDLGVQSLLDAPCGDFNWMRHVANGQLRQYIGVDVISELIAENQLRFGGRNRKFLTIDITQNRLPMVDMILCRDCLVHFTYQDIVQAFKNFKNSKSTFLLTTTFTKRPTNKAIALGDWQPINLERPPFCFPPPLKIINERCAENGGCYNDKSLALWELKRLPI